MAARRRLRIAAEVMIGILVLGCIGLFFGSRALSVLSIRKLDDHPLYVMKMYGDYGFAAYLQTNLAGGAFSVPQGKPAWGCTGFAALNPQGDPIYGRNFDWDDDPILVLYTDPPDGYASISTVDVRYLGITRAELTLQDRLALLNAAYLPFDGMNEYGLVVGMMAVEVDPPRDPNKGTIGSLEAIRAMLDYAKTVDEAVNLIGQYNIDFQGGPGIHYLVSDRGGHSAVIEFTDKKMSVLRSETPWQVSTNFVITGTTPAQARNSCWRYNQASESLEKTAGRLGKDEAMALLSSVAQPSTLWSVVYDMNKGENLFVVRRGYEKVYPFQLEMK